MTCLAIAIPFVESHRNFDAVSFDIYLFRSMSITSSSLRF